MLELYKNDAHNGIPNPPRKHHHSAKEPFSQKHSLAANSACSIDEYIHLRHNVAYQIHTVESSFAAIYKLDISAAIAAKRSRLARR